MRKQQERVWCDICDKENDPGRVYQLYTISISLISSDGPARVYNDVCSNCRDAIRLLIASRDPRNTNKNANKKEEQDGQLQG